MFCPCWKKYEFSPRKNTEKITCALDAITFKLNFLPSKVVFKINYRLTISTKINRCALLVGTLTQIFLFIISVRVAEC